MSSNTGSTPSTPSSSTPSPPCTIADSYLDFILSQKSVADQYQYLITHYITVNSVSVPFILRQLPLHDPEAIQMKQMLLPFGEQMWELNDKRNAYFDALTFYKNNMRQPEPSKEEPALRAKVEQAEKELKECAEQFKQEMAPVLRFEARKDFEPQWDASKKHREIYFGPNIHCLIDRKSSSPTGGDKMKWLVLGAILLSIGIILGWAIYCFALAGTNKGTGGSVEPVNSTQGLSVGSNEVVYGSTEPFYGSDDPSSGQGDLFSGQGDTSSGQDDPSPENPIQSQSIYRYR